MSTRHPIATLLVVFLASGLAVAQIEISGAKPRGGASPEVRQQIELLRKDGGWWKARARLVELARGGDRLDILMAMLPERDASDEMRERVQLVADEINREHTETQKRRERETRLVKLKGLIAKETAIGAESRRAIDALLAELEKSVAQPLPLDAQPVRVPVAAPDAPPRRDPENDPSGRTRTIDLGDGRQAVVEVPEGWEDADLKAEMKDGTMMVRRVATSRPTKDKAGDSKKPAEGPAPRPEEGAKKPTPKDAPAPEKKD